MLSLKPLNGIPIAENNDLARVHHRTISAAVKLSLEPVSSNVAVNVLEFSPNNQPVTGCLGGEHISHPFFGIERAMIVQHGPILVFLG
ncbi:MAG: hypothetical protein AAGL23_07095 [Pseudomonadota bacterium]